MTVDLAGFPAHLSMRGGDPRQTAEHLLHLITDAVSNHPRSLQQRVGPSELGHPCARRLGYKFLGKAERAGTPPNWKATVGTALHSWLEATLDAANLDYEQRTRSGQERFWLEQRVTVGQVAGVDVDGSCDVYDRATATVIDWKTCGPTQLTKYRRLGPGPQYRAQAHLYGRGWRARGVPVDTVMIVFLPRNGELSESYTWHEPYNESVAVAALQRADGIALAVAALGTDALAVLPTADAFCHLCPYFVPAATDLARGCPGDASRPARADTTTAMIA